MKCVECKECGTPCEMYGVWYSDALSPTASEWVCLIFMTVKGCITVTDGILSEKDRVFNERLKTELENYLIDSGEGVDKLMGVDLRLFGKLAKAMCSRTRAKKGRNQVAKYCLYDGLSYAKIAKKLNKRESLVIGNIRRFLRDVYFQYTYFYRRGDIGFYFYIDVPNKLRSILEANGCKTLSDLASLSLSVVGSWSGVGIKSIELIDGYIEEAKSILKEMGYKPKEV